MTGMEMLLKIHAAERRTHKVIYAFNREVMGPLKRDYYIEVMAAIYQEEIKQMAKDAMREVDAILGIPEAF
jgi:hypothetical protein